MTAEERMASLEKQPFEHIGSSGEGSKGFWSQVGLIFQHRSMLMLFVKRDLKSRYKDSALGFFWTLIKPITQLFIYWAVIGQFLGAARNIDDFAIYIFTGLTVYGLFSEIVMGGTGSIIANGGLVKKVYLPRELFPLAAIGSALFNFMIQLVILLLATIALNRVPLTGELIYFFPSLFVIMLFATALALLLSAVNVYLRDVQYLVEVFIMVLMWASPILYSWAMVAERVNSFVLAIYTNNPVTLAVLGFQRSIWVAGHSQPYPENLMLRLGIAMLVGAICVYLAQRLFARLQGNFAQML